MALQGYEPDFFAKVGGNILEGVSEVYIQLQHLADLHEILKKH